MQSYFANRMWKIYIKYIDILAEHPKADCLKNVLYISLKTLKSSSRTFLFISSKYAIVSHEHGASNIFEKEKQFKTLSKFDFKFISPNIDF